MLLQQKLTMLKFVIEWLGLCQRRLPITSLTRIECWRVRGALAPAALMALTRTVILHPGERPVIVYLVFSVSSELDTIQSSAVGNKQRVWFKYLLSSCWVCLEDRLLTSFYAVLHQVAIKTGSSDCFGRAPLYGHRGVSDILYDQHGGLTGHSWMDVKVQESQQFVWR